VALNVYRRHRRDCEAGHAEDSTSGEFAERARGWKRCACVIFVSGTLAASVDTQNRQLIDTSKPAIN
jgi:hypothetical protein